LMPPDPVEAIEAVDQAVRSGRISEERIRQSVDRIQRAKQKIGQPASSIDPLFSLGETPAGDTVAAILRHSQTVSGNIAPSAEKGRNLLIVDDLLNCDFLDRSSPAVTIPRGFGYEVQVIDRTTLKSCLPDDRLSLLQIFLRGNPFRGSAGLTEETKEIYRSLLNTGRIQGVIIYGSPYVFQWFRSQLAEIPHLFTYSQEATAQRIAGETLFGLSTPSPDKDREFT
jgi:beta-glucosidase